MTRSGWCGALGKYARMNGDETQAVIVHISAVQTG